MRLFLTGGSGQLGQEVRQVFADWIILAPGKDKLDLSCPEQSESALLDFRPDVVVHAGAMTQVDQCEVALEQATRVNFYSTAYLAEVCQRTSAKFVYISTDYVFDGNSSKPYRESDPTFPQSVYGLTKWLGEWSIRGQVNHLVVRTSWVYGDGKNFVRTMLRAAREGKALRVVGDQIGRPTWARDLAQAIRILLEKSAPDGIYNFQNSGDQVSWADFARVILKEAGIDHPVQTITTDEYLSGNPGKTIAPRPGYSVLSLEKISPFVTPRDWRVALAEYIKEEVKA